MGKDILTKLTEIYSGSRREVTSAQAKVILNEPEESAPDDSQIYPESDLFISEEAYENIWTRSGNHVIDQGRENP